MKTCKKLVTCIAMALAMCMMFTACGSPVNKVVSAVDGQGDGEVGTTFRTYFFDFSVDSCAFPSEYEGYTASEGMQLLDVVITVKNTFSEQLPMFNSDFQIQWHDLGNGEYDFDYGIEMDDSSTVMPSSYSLAKGDSCTYHVVYEVPAEAKEFSVSYQELFADETMGDVFFVWIHK